MKHRIRIAVSLAVTAIFLWWALRGVNWAEVRDHLARANWFLLFLSVVVSTLSIHVRALRWKTLLAPLDPNVPLRPRLAGTAIGFAANNLIPARVGEIVRCVVCARLTRLSITGVVGSLVVERVLDGLVTVVLLLVATSLPGFPPAAGILAAIRVVAAVMAAAAVVLIALAMMPERSLALAGAIGRVVLPQRLRAPVLRSFESLIAGLAVLRTPRLLALSVAWAVAQWLFISLSVYFAFLAFGIREPGYAGAVFLQCAINLAVAFPSAPGFFGPLEVAATKGLALWQVDPSRAVSFAIGYHIGGFITVTLLGLWYVQRLNLGWRELIGTAEKEEERVETAPPPRVERSRA